jgi:hypothetical protein
MSALLNFGARVATSLFRLIYDAPKLNDALVFMTMLSTDLSGLRKKGYDGMLLLVPTLFEVCSYLVVDRILHQQQAEREATEKAARQEAASSRPTPVPTPLISLAQPTAVPPPEKGEDPLKDEIGSSPGGLPPPSGTRAGRNSILANFRGKFANRSYSPLSSASRSSGMASGVSRCVTPLSTVCKQFGIQH